MYVKGGAFGNIWTLVSTTGGTGTNPATDNTYSVNRLFMLYLQAGDRVANIKVWDNIKQ